MINYKNILFILILLVPAIIQANNFVSNCGLDYNLMRLIAQVEKAPKRDIGYPYIISINKSIIIKDLKIPYKINILNNRNIDCLDLDTCVKTTKFLINSNIKNLDLGAFQLNYKWNKIPFKHYFTVERSYERACSNLEKLIDSHGYSWKTIAKYHSSTEKHNTKYLTMISKIIKNNKIQKEKNEKNK